jgi:hypothetical protein
LNFEIGAGIDLGDCKPRNLKGKSVGDRRTSLDRRHTTHRWTTPAMTPGGEFSRATHTKSAITNLRHAHRLFSSGHRGLLSIRDARLPIRTTQSKQRLDGNARVDSLVKSPDLTVPNRAKLSGHQDKRFKRDGILISARA